MRAANPRETRLADAYVKWRIELEKNNILHLDTISLLFVLHG
jgi:hypothetical protein